MSDCFLIYNNIEKGKKKRMGACQSEKPVATKTKKQWRIVQSETGPAKLTKAPQNKNNPQQKLKQTIY